MILGLFLHRLWTLPQSIRQINHNPPPGNSNHKRWRWRRRLKPERSLFVVVVAVAAAKFKLIREFAKTPVKDFVLAYGAFCTAGLFCVIIIYDDLSSVFSHSLGSSGHRGGEGAFERSTVFCSTEIVHLLAWRGTKRHPRKEELKEDFNYFLIEKKGSRSSKF